MSIGNQTQWTGQDALWEEDPEIWHLVKEEKKRQTMGLELIAAENFCSRAALEALGSCLNNKLSSGYAGSRGYGGTEFVDKIQSICEERALKAFSLSGDEWGVNVQPYSGTVANTAVYTALLRPNDLIMGLKLHQGGHFSHGFMAKDGMGSAAATYFQCVQYEVDPKTGFVDYENLSKLSKLHKPKLIIAGTSTHSRLMDYKKFRKICDDVDAFLMADIAHVSGLVVAGLIPSPFEYADIVTTTTHKSLRGVEGALIFYSKGKKISPHSGNSIQFNFEERINKAIFPGHQGGPHNNSIAGIAVALLQAMQPHFVKYQEQVLKNCKAIVKKLLSLGYTLESGGSDNHLVVVDISKKKADGATMEFVCNTVGLAVTYVPNGIRLGTPALTSRGLKEKDFERVVDFFDEAVKMAIEINLLMINNDSRLTTPKDFLLKKEVFEMQSKIDSLRQEIETFTSQFSIPGFIDR